MSGRPDIHSLLKKIMRSTMTEYKKGANHCNEIQEEDLVKDLRDGILEFIILKIIYIYTQVPSLSQWTSDKFLNNCFF